MAYKRDPNLPWYVRDSKHPATRAVQWFVALFFLPALAVVAWRKALQFDPYSMSFFTKTYVEPTADMPDELRIAGWVMIAIGALVAYAGLKGVVKRIGTLLDSLMILWVGALVMVFGGAFFAAADAAQDRIDEETASETRQA